ncbi:MAG: 3-methyladenine DNA glycosylase [Proteobacteria bacterium]|nr:MAG: 3-methyladenine DNA glycosylase [Pseudomonadota bacterium]
MILPQAFCRRDALEVAPALIGKRLARGGVVLEITEVEAYRPGDTASHTSRGRTARNAPMWGPAGCAYVYLCYGMHQLLNLVTNEDGEGAAVLIRACRPVAGLDEVRARRGGRRGPALLTGPGKVGQALAIDGSFNGHPLYEPGGLALLDGPAPAEGLLVGPRVGIDYADPADRDAPWRFAAAGTPWVSHRKGLARCYPATRRRARSVATASATAASGSMAPGSK